MTHAVPLDCPRRPDVAEPSLSVDEALGGAARVVEDHFAVPRIIEGA
jgi:Asp-tRNA(Asn)/Glu-tRNA(Gln) amidotransferase C subunit